VPFPRLTRRQDPIVTRFREVARSREDAGDVVLLDGPHVVLEALRADLPIELILATTDRLNDPAPGMRQFWSLAGASGAAIYDVTTAVMDAVSPVRTPTGIVALATWSPAPASALWQVAPALVVGLVDVQDPGNVGAVVRCADGLDATGVVMLGSTADPAGWKALRGAMGSTFRLPVSRGDVSAVTHDATRAGVRVVATVARDSSDAVELRNVDLTVPVLLLLGNEGAGLSEHLQGEADVRVYIDMRAGLDSFNVSVTAGLLLYEARRQRLERGHP
jgi:TrmH family RNA methyltransferase